MTGNRKGYCGYCARETRGVIAEKVEDSWHLEGDGTFGTDTHYLLRCTLCSSTFYQLARTHSENVSHDYDPSGHPRSVFHEEIEHYPAKPRIDRPSWLSKLMLYDEGMYNIMCEIYGAYDRGLVILATGGIRTAIDRLLEKCDIKPGLPFKEKIKAAAISQAFDPRLMASMEMLVEAGHAALHRHWAPSDKEVKDLIGLLERIIDNACFSPDSATVQRFKDSVPPRR